MQDKNKPFIEGLLGAPANPLMQTGLSLLASSYDPTINPWVSIVNNLANARQATDTQQDRDRMQKQREELNRFFMQQGMGPAGQPPMGAMSPAPPTGMPMPPGQNMANQVMSQQQRFSTLPYNQQQYLRNMALRGLFDTGE